MKKHLANYKRLTIFLAPDTYNTLSIYAKNNNESMSSVVRNIVLNNISQETISKNINPINDVVRRVVRDVIRDETERLSKLIVKTMKASAVSMYQGTQIIEDMGHNKGHDVFEDALKMAIAYIKTPFDSNDIPLPAPKDEKEDEMYIVTDDDLFGT